VYLWSIRVALAFDPEFEVVAEARSGAQVLPLVTRERPDVVLLDVRLPDLDGLACLARIREHFPHLTVVMLSAVDDQATIEQAMATGADGYVLKTIDPGELAAALRRARAGTLPDACGARYEDSVGERAREFGLTKKELEILSAVASGRTNKEIARRLWVTEQTVKFLLTNIYRKLGVHSRTEAARWAYEHGCAGTEPARA
jgi:DNA-binding NarL/FixJ family response regulator